MNILSYIHAWKTICTPTHDGNMLSACDSGPWAYHIPWASPPRVPRSPGLPALPSSLLVASVAFFSFPPCLACWLLVVAPGAVWKPGRSSSMGGAPASSINGTSDERLCGAKRCTGSGHAFGEEPSTGTRLLGGPATGTDWRLDRRDGSITSSDIAAATGPASTPTFFCQVMEGYQVVAQDAYSKIRTIAVTNPTYLTLYIHIIPLAFAFPTRCA